LALRPSATVARWLRDAVRAPVQVRIEAVALASAELDVVAAG
jgi:hypothetical protein